MAAAIMILSKSRRTLIKTLTQIPTLKSISTFPFLNQEPQLADNTQPDPSPLPPNPSTGSPFYSENWRNPIQSTTTTTHALIPTSSNPWSSYAAVSSVSESLDVKAMMDLFAELATSGKWEEMRGLFEDWTRALDRNGKPNRPTVGMWNHYLWACFKGGASAGELLDVVGQMVDYAVEPDTASFNVVLQAMMMAMEAEAAEKLLERMLQSGKNSLPNAESYSLVATMLLLQDQLDAALKYIDLTLKSGYALSRDVFIKCIAKCMNKRRLDNLVSIIERCKMMHQNKDLCPPWNVCNVLARFAIQNDSGKLALLAVEFMDKLISLGRESRPPIFFSVDEGLVVSLLAAAGRTYNLTLLDNSWKILRRSFGQKKAPNPETYLAKIYAYSSLGELEKAFRTLSDFEKAHGNTANEPVDDRFCPFTSLYPLVVACCKKGFESVDLVYFQLETLSQGETSYKSIAALNCIILGCANIWDLVRAYQTFEAIDKTFGLIPDIHSYNALMCAFGKLKKTAEASQVLEHLISKGVKPNAMSYSLLVDAYLINRDSKSALSVLDEMVDVGFIPSRATLKKVRRRCIRESDYDSNDRLDSLAKKLKIPLGTETRRDVLFNLEYATEYAG